MENIELARWTKEQPRLHVLHLGQCDPKKCTALKLKRLGIARIHKTLKTVPIKSIKLNPYAKTILSFNDRLLIMKYGLLVIDCSWNQAGFVFEKFNLKNDRKLSTIFLAGNPINYAIPGKLSSIEAIAAALIITAFFKEAKYLLSKFSWGHTFYELNLKKIEEFQESFKDREL
ncbi:MAG: DUF367 family protein [Promethearchaeota archaeon]